ncbi:MAG: hypothetical protein R2798_05470 [Chitinophagales bacterium]|nr:3-phosphoshikimate 1-carboxyvinyltransferase [Bacteroidota bacterium]MCB9042631.1 3-phosphoshikimate 1-carboxyvinyltransferase [Chitinophagales bacterium]
MSKLHIQAPAEGKIYGEIYLEGSKSISNRALIINALTGNKTKLEGLASAEDTHVLQQALSQLPPEINIGHAGTSMRFLTAFLACQNLGTFALTGSSRMLQRPIGILVDALNFLGADIQYLQQKNFPPLQINGKKLRGGTIQIQADVSSQYISALLMMAPLMQNGLRLQLQGNMVSQPYIALTLHLMKMYGVEAIWQKNEIYVPPQSYQYVETLKIEADWSAAAYYFSLTSLAKDAQIVLHGLQQQSHQGDAAVAQLYEKLGVAHYFSGEKLVLQKSTEHVGDSFFYNFINCPDIAQTVLVSCAALGIKTFAEGLQTLRIKETHRTKALQNELAKIGKHLQFDEHSASLEKGLPQYSSELDFATYQDHRMAMSFAPLALRCPQGINIMDYEVVKKSYPNFWDDMQTCGMKITPL